MEEKQNIIGVYKISNILSARYYIGYSTNIERRFGVHKSKLKNNCHDNIFLQRAYNLDGEDKFKYEIIHVCNTEEEAKEIELQYLTDLIIRDIIYNLNYNNSGGDLMTHHPEKEAIREKIIKSHKETLSKITLEERSKKYGKFGEKNGMYGKTHTDEVKKNNSILKKGNINFKGHKHTEETKKNFLKCEKIRILERIIIFLEKNIQKKQNKKYEKRI